MADATIISIAAASLITLSNFSEAYGFHFRIAGVQRGLAGLGYSLHVRFATIARIGTMLAYPLIGLQIDRGVGEDQLKLIAILTAVGLATSLLIAYKIKKSANIADYLFEKHIGKKGFLETRSRNDYDYKLTKRNKQKIFLWGFISNLIINLGIFLSFFMALQYHELRATILQSSAILTGIGTFISVIYFDPNVSAEIDRGAGVDEMIPVIYGSRTSAQLCAMIILLLAF